MCIALLAVLLAGAPDPVVAQGRRSYAAGEYLAAARLLESALASGIEDEAERVSARLYLAASLFAAGDRSASLTALGLTFDEEPQLAVDPGRFPPPFLAAVAEARAAHAAKQKQAAPLPPPAEPAPPPRVEGPPEAPPPSPSSGARVWAVLPLVVSVAGAGAATYFLVQAQRQHLALVKPLMGAEDRLSKAEYESLSASGSASQTAGWVLVGVAAAALVTAVLVFVLGGGG